MFFKRIAKSKNFIILCVVVFSSCKFSFEYLNDFNWSDGYLTRNKIQIPFESDNKANEFKIYLGQQLFYKKNLFKFNGISCTSCHTPKFNFTSFNLSANNNSLNHSVKKAPSLTNLAFQSLYGASGQSNKLENFIEYHLNDSNLGLMTNSLRVNRDIYFHHKKMYRKGDTLSVKIISDALSQYIRTIVSVNSELEKNLWKTGLIDKSDNEIINSLTNTYSSSVVRAIRLCDKCHSGVAWGGNELANNGLKGMDYKIKIPGIKNLSYSAPYMHDGRFSTIKEVVEFYNDGINDTRLLDNRLKDENGKPVKLNLSENEVNQMVEFLKTLDDTEFLNKYTQKQ